MNVDRMAAIRGKFTLILYFMGPGSESPFAKTYNMNLFYWEGISATGHFSRQFQKWDPKRLLIRDCRRAQ